MVQVLAIVLTLLIPSCNPCSVYVMPMKKDGTICVHVQRC